MDTSVTVDMLGSAYDTKIYIYDQDLNLVACNDDYHPDYTSRLEGVALAGGVTFFLVIDGYGGDAGDYALSIEVYTDCELDIPAGAVFEGEPTLMADYDDCYNFGCQTIICDGEPSHNFQTLLGDGQGELVFHGVSGWYTYQGANLRDGDSFTLTMGPTGVLVFVFDAEFPTYLLQIAPTDCSQASVVQYILGGACEPATMTITGEPDSEIWLDVAANTFAPPTYLDPDGDGVAEYDYLMEIAGLESGPVVVESMSLSAIQALYD